MKRSLSKPSAAISIVLAASKPVDAFFDPPFAVGASTYLFPPKNKILPNPIHHRFQHLSDHMPCRPRSVQSAAHVTPMHGDGSPDDASRREMMDIALGAMTGWILGPRVTFAASLSDPAITDEDDMVLSHPWDGKYNLLVEYYCENENGHARIAEKHRVGPNPN